MAKSNVALLSDERPVESRKLGPAEVVDVGGGGVEVRTEAGSVVNAVLALASPYEPRIGDVVLLISEGGRAYVIGLLSARGKTVLAFDGDVELRSNDGVVRIAGARGVEIEAPELGLRGAALRIVADTVVERVGSFTQRVRELFTSHVGARHEVVDGARVTHAKSTTFVSEDEVKINGRSIHLG
jgi:hypothetical protein